MHRGGSRGGRGRGGARANSGPPNLRGLFEKGLWHCDCSPRLPAEHFQVKKETPNKGRWFYTCQRSQNGGCGFFLWDDDAKPRMEAAVLHNSTTEPRPAPNPPVALPHLEEEQPPRLTTTSSPPPPYTLANPRKRKLSWNEYDEEEDGVEVFPWQLTGEEEQALSQATDEAAIAASLDHPRKMIKIDALSNPGTSRFRDGAPNGLHTPDTTPHKSNLTQRDPFTTPTASRHWDALATPGSEEQNTDLTGAVFELLKSANIRPNSETAEDLRNLLDKYCMRMQGIGRGREISRQALRTRDATIVSQAQRITALESDLESSRALIRHLREPLEERKSRP